MRARRHVQFHPSFERGHRHFRAQRRLVEGDRPIEPQIAPLDLEQRMRGDAHRHQRVARLAAHDAGLALAFQADLLAILHARRHANFQRAAARQRDARACAPRRLLQRNRHRCVHIGAVGGLARARAAGLARRATGIGEQLGKNVGGVEALRAAAAAAHVEFEILEARRAASRTRPFEPVEFRLAVGVDLAAVEGGALLVVAEQIVGLGRLVEALLGARILGLVGVVGLGQLAVGLFDVVDACRLGQAQYLIWIAHMESPVWQTPPARHGCKVPSLIWGFPRVRASR